MTGKILSVAAAALIFAGAYLAALDLAEGTRLSAAGGGTAADPGPQIILRDVEMVEMRRGGEVYRLASDEALYSIQPGRMIANRVTLTLPGEAENVVLTAPLASWDILRGQVDFSGGGRAETGAGWTASVPEANVDLEAGVITARQARLTGPGISLTGDNLRWRWQEGTLTLESPESRIVPQEAFPPRGEG